MKSSKLFAMREGRMLLVRRRRDGIWTIPGGKRKDRRESAKECLHRELEEELPALKIKRAKRVRTIRRQCQTTGRKRNCAIFVAAVSGSLAIGDTREIDRAEWRRPWRLRLSAAAKVARDELLARPA
jgi:ADP-ribose pyrophosphatase YjhB (NUDIX family)